MSWTIHVEATHPACPPIERVIVACPALVGRDAALNACALTGDDRVSKIHASIDVRDGRVLVRDAQSTNGTFVGGRALEPDRWTDVGAAGEDIALRIADWHIQLRARRVATMNTAQRPFLSTNAATVVDAMPFGASQSATALGSSATERFFVSIVGPVDRLREPAQAARAALEALRAAVVAEIENVPERDRAALLRRLREQYPDIRHDAALDERLARLVPDHVPGPAPAAATEAYVALQELSRGYVDGNRPVSTPAEILAFKERLRLGIDELVAGIVRLVSGVDRYHDRMDVDGAGAAYPRDADEFARALFEWRDEAHDGAQIARAAVLDVIVHQLGSFQATLRGVRELLNVLDPKTIEAEWRRSIDKRGRWKAMLDRLLAPIAVVRMYRQHHDNLVSEEDGWFRVLFGRKFAEEYQAFAREARASNAAPPTIAERRFRAPAPLPPAPAAGMGAPPPRVEARAAPGGTLVMATPLTPSAPHARGGTVAIAPALTPRAAQSRAGNESNE